MFSPHLLRACKWLLRPILALVVTLLGATACGPGGEAPVLQLVGDQVVAVNQELVIVLSAADMDGDEVFYSYNSEVPDIYSRASLNRLPIGVGEFRWTPRGEDVGAWFFDFTASDGGRSDTITVRVEVKSAIGNTAPRFLHPQGSGTTLDLDVRDCLTIDVEIVDSDTADVVIAQENPLIEGATLTATSGSQAIWEWCPSAAQIAAEDRYTLVLSADDGENPKHVRPYLLVLRRASKPDCPGEAPSISHQPEDVETLQEISLRAEISDDTGLKSAPLLYYTKTPPSDPPDLTGMIQLTMSRESGTMQSGTWAVDVPNPVVADPAGTTRRLYYLIVADDDDDPTGDCDHRTRSPASGIHSMAVTNPGGTGGGALCDTCTADVQCGDQGDLCVQVGVSGHCLVGCGDCPSDYICSSSPIVSVDGVSARQCIPRSMDCSDPGGEVCEDDMRENDDTREQAQAKPLLEPGAHPLVSCPSLSGVGNDEDWFELRLFREGELRLDLDGETTTDLDLALYDPQGNKLFSSTGASSIEHLAPCLPVGFYVARVYAASGRAKNEYTLSYNAVPMSCHASCRPDAVEPDNNARDATSIHLSSGAYESRGRTICSGDEDWFAVELGNGDAVDVALSFEQTASEGDLDIHMYKDGVDLTPCSPGNAGECNTTNGQSGNSNELMHFVAPDTGCASGCTYHVVVRGFNQSENGDENTYDIRIE